MRVDWAIGQDEKKTSKPARSKSEPRTLYSDLHDENLLCEQKRGMVKKILMLQRQKFRDNQARKTSQINEFESSTYAFLNKNSSMKNEGEHTLFEE